MSNCYIQSNINIFYEIHSVKLNISSDITSPILKSFWKQTWYSYSPFVRVICCGVKLCQLAVVDVLPNGFRYDFCIRHTFNLQVYIYVIYAKCIKTCWIRNAWWFTMWFTASSLFLKWVYLFNLILFYIMFNHLWCALKKWVFYTFC